MGLAHEVIDPGARFIAHAERAEVEPALLLVEEAQHHALAVPRRKRRDAHVDRAAGDAQRDAAVLRQALLGDVEARHHLHARHERGVQRARRLEHVAQRPVDAQAHERAAFERLDVHIRRALAQRLSEQRVDEADDRRVVLGVEEVGHFRQPFGQALEVDVVGEIVDQPLGAARVARVELREAPLEELRGEHQRAHRRAEDASRFADRAGGDAGAYPELDRVGKPPRRDHPLRAGEVIRQRADEAAVELGGEDAVGSLSAHCDGEDCGGAAGADGASRCGTTSRPGASGGAGGWPGASGGSCSGSCGPCIGGSGN